MAATQGNYGGSDEYKEETITVRRVSKVVKGGRIFSFSVLTAVGDGKGSVGIGVGKAREVPLATQKSLDKARRSMKKIRLNGDTVFYPIVGKHGAAKVVIRPASAGSGIVAGNTMRLIFECAGVQDVLAKAIGTTNSVNVARATIDGLTSIRNPKAIANKRGKEVKEIL